MSVTVVVAPDELDSERFELTGETYHHLFRVRRLDRGTDLRLVDGAGRARRGVVEDIDSERAIVACGAALPAREPALWLEVFVVPPRPQRATWLVEKGTELGVAAFRFVDSERADRRYGAGRFARLERVARAAVEQCGRSRVPVVSGMHDLDEAAASIADSDRAWVLAPGADRDLCPRGGGSERCLVLVGPEGGWAEAEVDRFVAAGAATVSMGPRILRVETAVVSAASLLLRG